MKVNGTECAVQPGITLLDYLIQENYSINRIAVEKNGNIIPKNDYQSTLLTQEDTLEIVQFVGGG